MARKKLKKFRMAVGLCGPQILYTNIIKAYTAEEAAIKYYEELGEEVSEEKLAETARQMYEIEDEKPLEAYYDCRKEPFGIGDNIFAILKEDKSHPAICRATVTALTNRGIKVLSNEKEYPIFVGKIIIAIFHFFGYGYIYRFELQAVPVSAQRIYHCILFGNAAKLILSFFSVGRYLKRNGHSVPQLYASYIHDNCF